MSNPHTKFKSNHKALAHRIFGRCVIQAGSGEVVVLHETARKEDAKCFALLELARLDPAGASVRRPVSGE